MQLLREHRVWRGVVRRILFFSTSSARPASSPPFPAHPPCIIWTFLSRPCALPRGWAGHHLRILRGRELSACRHISVRHWSAHYSYEYCLRLRGVQQATANKCACWGCQGTFPPSIFGAGGRKRDSCAMHVHRLMSTPLFLNTLRIQDAFDGENNNSGEGGFQ